jgi:3-oxoacyl-[acyl-carrier protein] reductase
VAEPKTSALGGKVALVTGGSNGIGAATARVFANKGAQVVIGYHQGADRAKRLIEELPGSWHSVAQIALENSQTIARAADEIRTKYGKLDILVNSAGFTRVVPAADLDAMTDEIMDSVLIANVRGTFAVIRAMAPLLRASGKGVIVNVSSIAAFTSIGSSVAYCAAKAAMDSLTMTLARALAPQIRVLSVLPGPVPTDFVAGRDRTAVENMAQKTPLKTVTETEDIAAAILACVTHLRTATGAKIVVDGGMSL